MGPYPVWDLPPQPSFKLNYRWTQHWSSLQNFKIPIFKYPSLLFQCTSLRQAKRRLAKPSEIGSQISVHVNSSMNRYTQFLTIYLSLLIDQISPPPHKFVFSFLYHNSDLAQVVALSQKSKQGFSALWSILTSLAPNYLPRPRPRPSILWFYNSLCPSDGPSVRPSLTRSLLLLYLNNKSLYSKLYQIQNGCYNFLISLNLTIFALMSFFRVCNFCYIWVSIKRKKGYWKKYLNKCND